MTYIYLDGHATTPLAPEAALAMQDAWSEPTNAGSPHAAGARAAALAQTARTAVARLIGAAPAELIFTSGATEANNLALLGVARALRANGSRRTRIVVTAIEHKSVLAPAEALKAEGFEAILAPVDRSGHIDLGVLKSVVDERTLLISVGAANGEIGVLQPLAEVAALARRAGVLVHSDLAQFAGRVACDVADSGLDYASLSSHKMYGPAGVGALYVAAGAPAPMPLTVGGGQEQGLRPGTLPVPLLVGFGAAAELARARLALDADQASRHASIFLDALSARQVIWKLNGHPTRRTAGSLSIQLQGVDAESLVARLAGDVAASTGSACEAGQIQNSHVLSALNLTITEQRSTLRLCFGRYNTDEEPEKAAELIAAAVRRETLAHWTPRPVAF